MYSPTSYKSIGARIKIARMEAGLTQTEFADKLGVTSVMISRYEGGKTSPMRQLEDIARILNKSTEYFFGGDSKDDLYEDIKELVKLLKERAKEDYWPFKPSVPLLDTKDIGLLEKTSLVDIKGIDSKAKVECSSELISKDRDSFAVKVDNNFHKSVFGKGTVLIVSPNTTAQKSDFVLRSGDKGFVVGKRSTTRGKLVGTVVQSLSGELV